MSRVEQRWVIGFTLILVLLSSLPYVAAYQAAGDQWVFSGLLIGVEDGNSYLAKMLRGNVGDWLFRTPYTTSAQSGVLTFLPYLLLGKLAGGQALRLQLVGLFHIFRVAAIFVYVWAIYQFAAYFLTSLSLRRWVTFVAAVGGGLGWLILPAVGGRAWPDLPLSFISPETFGFLSVLAVPHLAMARGLMLLSLLLLLQSVKSGGWPLSLPLLVLLTFLFNPLAGVALVLALAAFNLAQLGAATKSGSWHQLLDHIKMQLWAGVLAAPYVVYLALSYSRQPFLQAWSEQNLILSPHPGYYLLAYSLLLLPALYGLASRRLRGRVEFLFIASWSLILPALAYLPVGVQRRLTEGGWVALAVAAAWGLSQIKHERRRRVVLWSISLLASLSPLLLLWGMWRTALHPAQPAFITAGKIPAYQHLAAASRVDDVVIADFRSSNELPSYAPVRVPIGHGPESVNGQELQLEVSSFMQTDSTAERIKFLRSQRANWVLQLESDGLELSDNGPWALGFHGDGVRLYEVLVDP